MFVAVVVVSGACGGSGNGTETASRGASSSEASVAPASQGSNVALCRALLKYQSAEHRFLNLGLDPVPGRRPVDASTLRQLRDQWQQSADSAANLASGSAAAALKRMGESARRVESVLASIGYDLSPYSGTIGNTAIDGKINGALRLDGESAGNTITAYTTDSCKTIGSKDLLGAAPLPLAFNDTAAGFNCLVMNSALYDVDGVGANSSDESHGAFVVRPDKQWPYPTREGWSVLQSCEFEGRRLVAGKDTYFDVRVVLLDGPEWVCPSSQQWTNLEGSLTEERKRFRRGEDVGGVGDAAWFGIGTASDAAESEAGTRIGKVCIDISGAPTAALFKAMAAAVIPLVPDARP